MRPEIHIKRAYDAPKRADGFRVLVDRMWPRGVRKEDLHVKLWAKDIAPSTKLRQWFGHDPSRWSEFHKRYLAELKAGAVQTKIAQIVDQAEGAPAITLVYSAKDTEHNQAVVLQEVFERLVSRHSSQRRSD